MWPSTLDWSVVVRSPCGSKVWQEHEREEDAETSNRTQRASGEDKAAKALNKAITTVSAAIQDRRPISGRLLVFEDEKNYR